MSDMVEYKIVKITDLGTVNRGKSKHRPRNDSLLYGGKYPFIQTADIKKANLYLSDYSQTYNEIGLKQSKLWKKGTLCFTIAANIADSAILDIDACFPDSIVGFLPHENVSDTIYIKYLFDELKLYFQQISKGTTQDNLSLDKICRVKLKVPNYETQKKIALVLSSYDNLIENNNKRIKLLEQMAENLYKEWFVRFRFPGYEDVDFENGIPKGWEILRANQLFDITIGKTPDRKIFEYFSNIPECNYPWISISDMRSASTFVFKTKEYLTFNAVSTCNVKIIPKNTVLVSFKLTVGQVAITTSDMCTNEAIAHFTTDNATMREYIYLYLKKFQYSDLGNTSSIGTAVNSKIIKNMKIILPSSELLNLFHDYVYSIFEEIRLLNETNSNLTKQRDLLLPRLMSGKLEV